MTSMSQDRGKRVALNSIFSLSSWLAPVVLSFFVTPLVLKRLGNDAFGIYVVVLGFVAYSFTFGVGRAAAKYVAEFNAAGDRALLKNAVTNAFWLSVLLGVAGAVIIGVLAPVIVDDVLRIGGEYRSLAIFALVVGGASIPFTMAGQVFQGVLQGAHLFGRQALLTNLLWILINVGNLILVVCGFGVAAMFVWNLTVSALMAAAYGIAARQQVPEATLGSSPGGEMLRPVFRYSSSVFLYQIFGNLLLLFERGWITQKFGVGEATYYIVPMTLTLYMHGFIASIAAAAFPVFNELLADRSRLLALYERSTKAVLGLTVYFSVSLIATGDSFLRLWIDPGFAERSYPLLVVHTLTFGLIAAMVITWQINEAFHSARFNAYLTFVWALIAVPAMIFSVESLGILGVALSRLAGVVVTVPVIFYSEKRFLGSIRGAYWLKLAGRIGLAAAAMGGIERVLLGRTGASWPSFISVTLIGTAVYILVLYLTRVLGADEMALIRAFTGGRRDQVQNA